MQLTQGNLYWRDKTKILNTYPYLTQDISCDVLIIGGGIAGAITAYILAEENANVVVVEKNIIGYGSTLASSANLQYELNSEISKLKKIIGTKAAIRMYQLCLNAIEKLEKIDKELDKNNGFKKLDSILYSNKFMQKSNMAKEFQERKNAGFNSFFVDSHSILNLSSGILTKNSSAIVNPYLFTQSIFELLSKKDNVKIYENTEIKQIKTSIDNVLSFTNNKFKITSSSVIFTTGYETLKYFERLPVDLYKNFTIVTKPIKELKNFDISFTARDSVEPYHYLRFDTNSRIMFTGEEVKFTEKLTNPKLLSQVANYKYNKLFNVMKKTVYPVSDLSIDYTYNGTYAKTKDSLPIVDEMPNKSNCFCNLGFGSNSILHLVIGANMLKNAINGLYTKDMNLFRLDR